METNTERSKMRAKEFITELFDSKGVKWDMQDEDIYDCYFKASNGVRYRIDFLAPHVGPDEIDPYDIMSEELPDELRDRCWFVEFSQVDKKDSSVEKQGIEGTGASAEVFGIVINAILKFIKKQKPVMLYFQAVEPSRQSLYAAITNRLGRSIGWQVKQVGPHFYMYNKKLEGYLD
jgi:hypothetical protein